MSLGDIGKFLDENHYGSAIDVGGDFFAPEELSIEETVVRAVDKSKKWNWKKAFARELMRGGYPTMIMQKYGAIIKKHNFEKTARKYLDANYGVLGYLVIDASQFNDKFSYEDIPENMRQFNAFVMNSPKIKTTHRISYVNTNDGTMDGFMQSTNRKVEEVTREEELTGLDIISSLGNIDNELPVLDKVADVFLKRGIISFTEREKLSENKNKFANLCVAMKRHLLPKAGKTGKIENDVKDYGLANPKMAASPIKAVKNIKVTAKEARLDNIGKIVEGKEQKLSKLVLKSDKNANISLDKKAKAVNVINDKEARLDDIGKIVRAKTISVENDKEMKIGDIGKIAKANIQKISIAKPKSERDMKVDVKKAKIAKIDETDFFSQGASKQDIEYDKKAKKELKISNKFDFGW